MNTYYIELKFGVASPSPDFLDKHLDDVMDRLIEEPGAYDADIGAELSTGRVSLCMYIDAKSDDEALGQALLVSRSAVHAAGGFTGGWLDGDGGDESITVEDTYDLRVQPAELADT